MCRCLKVKHLIITCLIHITIIVVWTTICVSDAEPAMFPLVLFEQVHSSQQMCSYIIDRATSVQTTIVYISASYILFMLRPIGRKDNISLPMYDLCSICCTEYIIYVNVLRHLVWSANYIWDEQHNVYNSWRLCRYAIECITIITCFPLETDICLFRT